MIAAIELAIIERLRSAGAAALLGYSYRTLETYPEEWDAYLKDKGPIAAPAGWVTFAGWRPLDSEDLHGRRFILTFGLVVMAENLRGETATRHGGPSEVTEPGSYRLATDAARLFIGQDLGLDMDGLAVGNLRHVRRLEALQQRKVSMLALELQTAVKFSALDFSDEDALADFTKFHANWDVPPHGGVDADPGAEGVQLPADEAADATDHVELETQA